MNYTSNIESSSVIPYDSKMTAATPERRNPLRQLHHNTNTPEASTCSASASAKKIAKNAIFKSPTAYRPSDTSPHSKSMPSKPPRSDRHSNRVPLESSSSSQNSASQSHQSSNKHPMKLQTPPSRVGEKRKYSEIDPYATTDEKDMNWAWLDMLLALSELKYRGNSPVPVDLQTVMAKQQQHREQESREKDDETEDKVPLPNAINSASTGLKLAGKKSINPDASAWDPYCWKRAAQIHAVSSKSSVTCNCKGRCLKMYCACFSNQGFCGDSCKCQDCLNQAKKKPERIAAIQHYLTHDPSKFAYAPTQPNDSDIIQLLPKKVEAIERRGCKCKNSRCLKNYCECFQNGLGCTSQCRCVGCKNTEAPKNKQEKEVETLVQVRQVKSLPKKKTGKIKKVFF